MSTEGPFAPPAVASPGRFARVEYLDFRNGPDHREYRLAVFTPEGATEFRFRIATGAFGVGRLRLQDGPDLCYQKLLRAVAAGVRVSNVVTIEDVDLISYREMHTHAPKHRSGWTPSPAKAPFVPRPELLPPPPRPVAPVARNAAKPALDEGQRVRHAVFGVGVTASSGGGRTLIRFDEGGPKTFVTSLLQVDVLSAPYTWESTPRGKNLLRTAALEPR